MLNLMHKDRNESHLPPPSKATPMAYGGSQARGLIGAVAAGLHQGHSNTGSEPCLQPTP